MRWIDSQYHSDLAAAVLFPKRPQLVRYIYSDEEIAKIVNYLMRRQLFARDMIIFLLMYDCGLRLSEVLYLQSDCIFFDKHLIKVTGKGSKERLVPFGATLEKYLLKYRGGDGVYLRCRDGTPITESTIRNLFRKIRKNTGVKVSPHNLRHNFATNFLLHQIQQGSVDLYQLQSIMGHSDSETTKVYLHFAQELLALSNPYSKFDSMDL